MLTISNGSGLGRRQFLTAGSLALGGWTLSSLLAVRGAAGGGLYPGYGQVGYLSLSAGRPQPVGNLRSQARSSRVDSHRHRHRGDLGPGCSLWQLDGPPGPASGQVDRRPFVSNQQRQPQYLSDRRRRFAERQHRRAVFARRRFHAAWDGYADQLRDLPGHRLQQRGQGAARVATSRPRAPWVAAMRLSSLAPEVNCSATCGSTCRATASPTARPCCASLISSTARCEVAGELSLLDQAQKQAYQVLLSGGVADALDLSKEDPKTLALLRHQRLCAGRRLEQGGAWQGGVLHRPRPGPGQTTAAGPAAVRGRVRLRDHSRRLRRRLGHARRLQQPEHEGRHGSGGTGIRSRGGGVRRGLRGPGPERQDPARLLRRDGTDAQAQQERRPGSLGPAGAAAPVRRRLSRQAT